MTELEKVARLVNPFAWKEIEGCWAWQNSESMRHMSLNIARQILDALRDSDGSGEADKTGTGLAVGDSAGRNGIAENTSSNPPTTRGKA